MGNVLYYGDNLDILRGRDGQNRQYFPDESVDLIYLDPPFNSKRSYNLLFKDQHGVQAPSQMRAFDDTWTWARASDDYDAVVNGTVAPFRVQRALRALSDLLGTSEMMAYLAMMTPRLMEMHRVLKATGSLYLHCDPLASHYLKIVLDTIFGPTNFRSEIVWKRTSAHSSAKRYGPVHDVLLFYTKSDAFTWNQQYEPHDPAYVASHYRNEDAHGRFMPDNLTAAGVRSGSSGQPWRGFEPAKKGNHWKFTIDNLERLDKEGRIYWPAAGGWPRYRRYLHEMQGVPLQDTWTDIPPINAKAAERLGYQTQKPLALLKRLIAASSNPGDVVLDPFCGCGTAIDAAQELGRAWRGIDITHLAIDVITTRLAGRYDIHPGKGYALVGVPRDIEDARKLAKENPEQFE
jgi:DNA modification methylase